MYQVAKKWRTISNPFATSEIGIRIGVAGHVFGFRPSKILGIENTARGLWLDMQLVPLVLTYKYQGRDGLDEVLAGDTAGNVTKGVSKSTSWMAKSPKIKATILKEKEHREKQEAKQDAR